MKHDFKILSATLALSAAIALAIPSVSEAAPLTITGPVVADGSTMFSSQGSCNTAGGVTFSLMNDTGTTTSISGAGTTNYNSVTNSYDFTASNVQIPATYAAGPSTLVARCTDGTTYYTPITVLASNRELLNFGTSDDSITGPVTVSGFCSGSNNNGTVTFSLNDGTSSAVVSGVSANATGSNGAFTATLSMPQQYSNGLATLTASCPNGDTSSILTVLGNPITSGNLGTGNGGGVGTDVGGNPSNVTTNDPAVLGESTSNNGLFPVGGVAAGQGGTSNSSTGAALVTVLLAALTVGGYRLSKNNA